MLFDSHTHLNFKAFNDDRAEVMARCQAAGLSAVNVGAAYDTSQKAAELADGQNFYAAIGLHPIHVFDEAFVVEKFQALIDQYPGKIVAMGETGFDYHHLDMSFAKGAQSVAEIKYQQREVFLQHIALAKKNNLALIVHGRNGQDEPAAYQDIYQVLKSCGLDRAVVHCFGGNLQEAQNLVALGVYIGITGIITFDKTGLLESIVKSTPLDRLLIETDAPYLAPEPYRGKRNEPLYVERVAAKIANILGRDQAEIVAITGQNAKTLFNIK